jgi:hypothetical protein
MEALEVGDVAGNVKRKNLTAAGRKDFVAAREAFEHKAALRGLIALAGAVSCPPLNSLSISGRALMA